MKKLLVTASLFTLPAVSVLSLGVSGSAIAAGKPQESVEARISTLETALAAEKARNEETRALLEQTLAYLEKQSKASEALLVSLDEAETQGFAVGENWQSRQTLLAGFRTYGSEQQVGLPKLPAKPAPKPAAPARRAPR